MEVKQTRLIASSSSAASAGCISSRGLAFIVFAKVWKLYPAAKHSRVAGRTGPVRDRAVIRPCRAKKAERGESEQARRSSGAADRIKFLALFAPLLIA